MVFSNHSGQRWWTVDHCTVLKHGEASHHRTQHSKGSLKTDVYHHKKCETCKEDIFNGRTILVRPVNEK